MRLIYFGKKRSVFGFFFFIPGEKDKKKEGGRKFKKAFKLKCLALPPMQRKKNSITAITLGETYRL